MAIAAAMPNNSVTSCNEADLPLISAQLDPYATSIGHLIAERDHFARLVA